VVARFAIKPELLAWAIERAGADEEAIAKRFPDFPRWESQELPPTLKQLEAFAQATHTSLGTLFLPEPPHEIVPIPDFRTVRNAKVTHPSGDLLDAIYLCQMRQDWYRGFISSRGEDRLPFVGSATLESPTDLVASEMRGALGFGLDARRSIPTWEEALNQLSAAIENLGVLVMVSGIVGNNTRRVLNPSEFRGFALADELAPLVFVNGADSKSAQMFTMIHELAHIWLGETALSDVPVATASANRSELWCNAVAAEVLVPLTNLLAEYRGEPSTEEFRRLAKVYKVSTLVVVKRLYDGGQLNWDDFRALYEAERQRVMSIAEGRKGGGGNFYYTQRRRLSPQFVRAVAIDTLEGRTLHRDAYELLGTRKHETFVKLAAQVGVAA
jgi:Zn-dependent peptidase ImmA (M78 family)